MVIAQNDNDSVLTGWFSKDLHTNLICKLIRISELVTDGILKQPKYYLISDEI